jgi:hypothetical protein
MDADADARRMPASVAGQGPSAYLSVHKPKTPNAP